LGTTTTYNEEELLMLLKQQDRQAFNYLYRQYSGALYSVILKVIDDSQTAQDVLQDVFVKIWNNVGQYDAGRGRIYTWMLNIARNAAIDKLRSKGEIMKSKIQTGEHVVNNLEQNIKTEQKTDTIGLRKMVDGLKPEYAAIVELAYFNGFTTDEISKTLGIPQGTVKTRMRSAMCQLREIFAVKKQEKER
jgi:RNA polymerase sigma factor (sigma-70 family)